MSEIEFWKHIKPLLMVMRQAILMIVRFIEKRYNLRE